MISMGGGGSEGSQQSSSQQGFRDLPPEIQNAFKDLAVQAQGFLPGNNSQTSGMFTPIGQTAGETQAINATNAGFAPTSSSIKNDMSMQMNPYDTFVIDEINRQSQGANSILQKNMSTAGQFGSNRQFLGANDIDLSRLNQIGTFKQGQFNTAMNNALTTLPQQRASDAAAQMGVGGFQRNLNAQTQQAPVNALAAISSILGVLPTNSGQSSSSGSNSGSNWNFGFNSSDRNIKENIKKMGKENGFNVYEFNYVGNPKRYVGVMAQEVEKTRPDAVREFDGIKHVNYSMIGVDFREVA